MYPDLAAYVTVMVYDVGPKILGMFDETLGKYAMEVFRRDGVRIRTSHHIEELRWGAPDEEDPEEPRLNGPLTLRMKNEGNIGLGMCLWASGDAINPLIQRLSFVPEVSASEIELKFSHGKSSNKPNIEKREWKLEKNERSGAFNG